MSKTLKTTQLKNKTRSTAETTTAAATTKRATGTTATTKRTTATTKASGATTKTSESTASKKILGSTATIKATGTTKPSATTKPTATIKTTTGSNSTTSTPRSRTLSKAGSIDGASTKTTTAATGAATTTTIKAKPQTTAKRPTAGTTTKPTAETKTTSKTSNSLKTSNLLKTSNSVTSSKTSTSSKTPTSSKTSTSSKTPTSSRTTATSRNVASSERSQPMRAQHSAAILEAVRKHATPTVGPIPGAPRSPARPNPVLDTYHNVTVVSPPPKRRELPPRDGETAEETNGRPRTRTLDTEEVVVLRSASAKRRSERLVNGVEVETVERETMSLDTRSLNSKSLEPKSLEPNSLEPEKPKEPIAFEVTFDERQKSSRDRSRSRPREGQPKPDKVKDETAEYSDDFESYESDFETGSTASTNQNESTTTSESEEGASEEGESEEGESEEGESEEASEDDSELDSESPPDGLKKGHETDEEDEDEEEESELTQFPVTVIQREKERKLDSGHYEMNSRKQQQQQQLQQQHQQQSTFDSLDTFSAGASEQLDSGISSYGNGIQNHDEVMNQGGAAGRKGSEFLEGSVVYGGYAAFNTRPVRTQRGLDLMSKIQFDTLSFTLLDLRPIAYDEFMRTFGKLNTTQSSTQTRDHRTATEAQTEACDVRSMWTQHPPQYDLQTVQRLTHGLGTVQNCCGELQPQDGDLNLLSESSRDDFDRSLQALGRFRAADDHRSVRQQLRRLRKPVDVERLNGFLLHASLLVSRVLASNSSGSHPTSTSSAECLPLANATPLATVSRGYRRLGTGLLDALRVVRIFANAKFNLVITVHESRPEADVYRSDFSNLLMVWSISDCSRPLRLMSTWSDVCRAEICNESADIVVCGLRDGSVAMWDLRETYSFCSKLDGHLTHFAATQSIVPSWGSSTSSSSSSSSTKKLLLDLGAVVDVKSFRSPPKKVALGLAQAQSIGSYKTIQFASLNDSGILAVWTLVETTTSQHQTPRELSSSRRGAQASTSSLRSEFSSPWARVKLIQSAICDLREYLEHGMLTSSRMGQTKFDQTKALFQKNIYSDDVLRELNETQSELRQGQGAGSGGLKGLRFTSIDVGVERIYVCTNRNFILACSKSLKAERFRKITINESRFLFPTALRVLTNEFFLAVGLSNGSVMILNCDHSRSSLAEGASKGSGPSRREAERAPPPTAASTTSCDAMSSDIDLVTGKSCAIQNIILNERRFNDRPSIDPGDHELRPSTTAACLAMIEEQKKPFELRVYDQQILLSGSGLRKHLVQSLELTNDGWKLFALSNGEVRVYDFYLDREVVQHGTMGEGGNETKVVDMTVTSSGPMEHQLLLLSGESEVQIHLLKQ